MASVGLIEALADQPRANTETDFQFAPRGALVFCKLIGDKAGCGDPNHMQESVMTREEI